MKLCCKCKEEKELSEFGPKKRRGKVELRSECLSCYNAYHVSRRQANKKAHKAHRETVKRNTLEKREWVQSLKHNKQCSACGLAYPHWVMDFDHRPGEVKVAGIARMYQNYGRKTILEEIAKCDLVCSNCHRDRTYHRRHSNVE